jgi:nucleoside-diphosphate-sugar epimerase
LCRLAADVQEKYLMGAFPSTAFATGATGLFGNHLVCQLLGGGSHVKALARSRSKAEAQFGGLPVEHVSGDICNVSGFAQHPLGVDVPFHTAAHFRGSFNGGRHRDELFRVNVQGTRDLLSHAYSAGIRRFAHTSSSAVLTGNAGHLIDETMSRPVDEASDYPRSKIQADQEVAAFLKSHSDASARTVLPGRIVGPADMGPTASGQVILDFPVQKTSRRPTGSISSRGWPLGSPVWLVRINSSRFIEKVASFQLSGHSRPLRLHRDKLPLKSNYPCQGLQGSH